MIGMIISLLSFIYFLIVGFNNLFNLLNFDNHSLVQFYHRTLAYLLYFYSIYVGCTVFNYAKKDLNKIFLTYFSFLNIQVVLGILTLISGLNMQLSVLHQFIGVILVLTSLKLTYRISK